MKKHSPRKREDANDHNQFTAAELRTLRALKTPAGIQRLIDRMPYHLAGTSWSPRMVLRERTCHCLEGAIFGAAALRALGFPALVVDLEAENDTDHVIAVYNVRGHWGALAKSNYTGCRYREPVYRNIRELALSYFDVYFNLRGERTLRRYSKPVDLSRFDQLNWMTAEKSVWFIAEYLCEIPHFPLLKPWMEKSLTRLDQRSFDAGTLGLRTKPK
jgi:hypothetical protein